MIYVVFESIKLICWVVIIVLATVKRKHISVDMFWLIVISSVFMALGSIDDLTDIQTLINKSDWWLAGNLFIIANYFYTIRRSEKFFCKTKKKISEFVKQVENDIQKLNEQ